MPKEMKNEIRSEVGRLGGEAKAHNFATQTNQTVTIQDIVSCDRCHVSTSTPVEWNNHQLCEQCHKKALANPDGFNSYFGYQSKKPESKVVLTTDTPRSLDSWEHRKAVMSPQKSAFEERVVFRFKQWLSRLGLSLETDRKFCVLETTPDAYVPELEGLCYLDGAAVHSGNREDKDERLRELLQKHNPELKIQGFAYKADTKEEEERVFAELQKWVESLSEASR
jgi:hypothetical protein